MKTVTQLVAHGKKIQLMTHVKIAQNFTKLVAFFHHGVVWSGPPPPGLNTLPFHFGKVDKTVKDIAKK